MSFDPRNQNLLLFLPSTLFWIGIPTKCPPTSVANPQSLLGPNFTSTVKKRTHAVSMCRITKGRRYRFAPVAAAVHQQC